LPELPIIKGVVAGLESREIQRQIKRSDEVVAKWWDTRKADMENTMQGFAQDLGQAAIKVLFKPDGEQKSEKFKKNTDVPIVRVKQGLNAWVSWYREAEARGRAEDYQLISYLQDIASAEDPAKEAKTSPYEVRFAMPKTYKDALKDLESLHRELATFEFEVAQLPLLDRDQGRRNLQLMIEEAIWATTYDFRLRPVASFAPLRRVPAEPPLPPSLWERLVERYIDPDANKSYKEAGPKARLGRNNPPKEELAREESLTRYLLTPKGGWTPRHRLAWHFSGVLYPQLQDGYNDAASMLRKLRKGV
jgi:hypothetical protein